MPMRMLEDRPKVAKAALAWLLSLQLVGAIACAPDRQLTENVPSYKQAPVFYESNWEYYGAKSNLKLMPEGRADIGVMGIVPIANFDWSMTDKDASYWVAMENFRYLLPLIDSDEPANQTLAADWIDAWIDAHRRRRIWTPGSLDLMSVAHRSMTFVWYLRRRFERGDPVDERTKRIENALVIDQEFLLKAYRSNGNHGFWGAMGLFETTRVHPDSSIARTALDRLLEMTRVSISSQGLHKEHASDYHFWVWNWLQQDAAYLKSLEAAGRWHGLAELVDTERRMGRAAYYLYDHAGNMAQIGDTDAKIVGGADVIAQDESRQTRNPVLFDEEAGLAVYKDPDLRYVVFGIQNTAHAPAVPYHCHDDVAAVYYAHDGEVILGDAGKYAYVESPLKQYYNSSAAHNAITRKQNLGAFSHRTLRLAGDVSWTHEPGGESFSAKLDADSLTRRVNIPRERSDIEVVDLLAGTGPFVMLWNLGNDVTAVVAANRQLHADDGSTVYSWTLTTARDRVFDMRVSIHTRIRHAVAVVKGQQEPFLGWYSPAQHVSLPATVIQISLDVELGSATIITIVSPHGS